MISTCSLANDTRETYDAVGTDVRADNGEGPAESSKELCCTKDVLASLGAGGGDAYQLCSPTA